MTSLRDDTRARILDIAWREIRERGSAELTIAAIAAAAVALATNDRPHEPLSQVIAPTNAADACCSAPSPTSVQAPREPARSGKAKRKPNLARASLLFVVHSWQRLGPARVATTSFGQSLQD